jgi:CDGSH-type Zn-finger protein
MSDETRITLKEDGPFLVKSPPPIINARGDAVEHKETAPLCRCGASSTKPFCDGTHRKIGWSGTSDREGIRNHENRYEAEVEGQTVVVSYTPVLCSHAATCVKAAGDAFEPGRDPWVMPEKGTLAGLYAAVKGCPSGALRLAVGDGEDVHLAGSEASIRVEKDGPYHVRNVPLEAEFNGVKASPAKYTLCRCGLSKNKPFCDGTHYDAGWKDDAEGGAA